MSLLNIVETKGYDFHSRKIVLVNSKLKHITIGNRRDLISDGCYNSKAEETFHVIKGCLNIQLEDVFDKSRINYYVSSGKSLTIPVYTASLITHKPNSEFLVIANREFEREDVHQYNLRDRMLIFF